MVYNRNNMLSLLLTVLLASVMVAHVDAEKSNSKVVSGGDSFMNDVSTRIQFSRRAKGKKMDEKEGSETKGKKDKGKKDKGKKDKGKKDKGDKEDKDEKGDAKDVKKGKKGKKTDVPSQVPSSMPSMLPSVVPSSSPSGVPTIPLVTCSSGSILISEFMPNPTGFDPTLMSVELSGPPDTSFSGVFITIEADSGSALGVVDDVDEISGTFDSNGLLVVEIPDIENPTFTVILADEFTGDLDSTDIDTDDDGSIDADFDVAANFGSVCDALTIPDRSSDERMYGSELGGSDFTYTGDEPRLVFREGSVGPWYAINDPDNGEVFNLNGIPLSPALFDSDPLVASFGTFNPSLVPQEPSISIAPSSYPTDLPTIVDSSVPSESPSALTNEPTFVETSSLSPTTTVSPTLVCTDAAFGPITLPPDDSASFLIPGVTPETPDPTMVSISEIQGSGSGSPFEGQILTTSGVVTAVDSNLFYVQDPVGDGDESTSDAMAVFTGSMPPVSVGDQVEITGTVSEFTPGGTSTNNLASTQISGGPSIVVVSSGNALPEPVSIGNCASCRTPPTSSMADAVSFFEPLEAMLVNVVSPIAIAGTNRFGEIFTVVENGVGATGFTNRGTLKLTMEDYNPEKVQIDVDAGVFSTITPNVAAGTKFEDVVGVVGYNFGNFEIIPIAPIVVAEAATLEGTVTTLSKGPTDLLIGCYNVLNLDPNDDDGDTDIASGRFDTIASHIVSNMGAPDIVALQEIQDNSGSTNDTVVSASETLLLLIERITAIDSSLVYQFIDNTFIGDDTNGGQPGGNIRVAFLFNPARVNPVTSNPVVDPIDQQTNTSNPFFDSRPSLAATFEFNGMNIEVVNNHFSSKGGSSPIVGRYQPFEQLQAFPTVNGGVDERLAQTQAVREYVTGKTGVVVLGDMNEFEFNLPIQNLVGTPLKLLTETVPAGDRYSFIFQGNSQALDHALISPDLCETGAAMEYVHVNTGIAELSTRGSDHDPLVVQLKL